MGPVASSACAAARAPVASPASTARRSALDPSIIRTALSVRSLETPSR